jgi:hypothetical protein
MLTALGKLLMVDPTTVNDFIADSDLKVRLRSTEDVDDSGKKCYTSRQPAVGEDQIRHADIDVHAHDCLFA